MYFDFLCANLINVYGAQYAKGLQIIYNLEYS